MVDIKKYADIYEEIKKLNDDDTIQLVLESEDEEMKDFYELVGDFLLQQRQKKVVEENMYEVSNNDALKPVFNFEMRDVEGNVKINADDVQEVKIVEEDFGEEIEFCIKVCFTEEGGEKLKKVTTELVGKELAIYAGEELISRPIINCPIEGGEAIISGFDSYDEAEKSLLVKK
ncbi:MAG: hypothetical protein E7270_11865 [Lachnospiraceae bacterium]|nr:hypothetical protein [Lachnospiraceae bacterium]